MRSVLLAPLFLTGIVAASETHRQSDVHVHGHAVMNLVVSGDELEIEFDSPAMNLIGFEHQATSADDKETLDQAVDFLREPSNWIYLDSAAGCQLAEMDIESSLLSEDEHEGEEHQHEHAGEEHHHEHEGEHEDEEHSEFEVVANYSCSDVDKLKKVDFSGLFEQFPGLEDIDVQWLTDETQSSTELNRQQVKVTLNQAG